MHKPEYIGNIVALVDVRVKKEYNNEQTMGGCGLMDKEDASPLKEQK